VNLANVVRFWAGWNPDGIAVIAGEERVSWAALEHATSRLANGLKDFGIAFGDRVGILSGNRREYLELAIALYKLGAVLVPLNVRLTPRELAHIIHHAGCRALAADGDLAGAALAALDGSDRNVRRIGLDPGFGTPLDALGEAADMDPDAQVAAVDLAYICYTSGTTGTPKGAMLSHGNVLAMAHHSILADRINSN